MENPDILKSLGSLAANARPRLVVGFAAETEKIVEHARAKLDRKKADWIVANDVSPDSGIGDAGGVMGGDRNRVRILSRGGVEEWPELTKQQVAERLAARICDHLAATTAIA